MVMTNTNYGTDYGTNYRTNYGAGKNIGRDRTVRKSDVINEIRQKLKQDMQRITKAAYAMARQQEAARLAAWQFKYGYRGKLWQSDTSPASPSPSIQFPTLPSALPPPPPGGKWNLLAERQYVVTCTQGFRWVGTWKVVGGQKLPEGLLKSLGME
jgi:hypothetical protein